MNLLNLPIEALMANVFGILLCAGIMIACTCRLNLGEPMPLRLSMEQAMLVAFAFWAAGTAHDLWEGELIGFHNAAAGFGITMYLLLSFRHWNIQDALLREAAKQEKASAKSATPFGYGSWAGHCKLGEERARARNR